MAETTGIEWANATWNPWMGCHKVSAGCKNCYMFRLVGIIRTEKENPIDSIALSRIIFWGMKATMNTVRLIGSSLAARATGPIPARAI